METESTNENLCTAYQNGDHEALCKLWEKNEKLLFIMLQRLHEKCKGRAAARGIEFEDLLQSGFIAVESAARAYRHDTGAKFSTYLQYHVRSVFFSMIGFRTEREKRDILACAERFETPIPGDNEQLTIGDTIPDKISAEALENVEEHLFFDELSKAICGVMNKLTDQQAEVLRKRFYNKMTVKQIANQKGVSTSEIRRIELNALSKMRRHSHRLRSFAEELIFDHAYNAVGFNAWKNSGSIQERIIERIERKYT